MKTVFMPRGMTCCGLLGFLQHFNVEIQVIVMGKNATSLTCGDTSHPARSGRIFLLYSGQHYDALVAHQSDKLGLKTVRMFPVGLSEMSSLALACGMQVFENSINALDEVGMMMSLKLQHEYQIDNVQAQAPSQPQSMPSRYFSTEYPHTARSVEDETRNGDRNENRNPNRNHENIVPGLFSLEILKRAIKQ